MNSLVWKRRLSRIREFSHNASYRQLLWYRLVLTVVNRLLPHVTMFGIKDQGLTMLYHSYDRAITLAALVDGHFNIQEIERTMAFLESQGYSLTGDLIEVGANIGTTTIGAARKGQFRRIYAFEPLRANLDLIRANVSLNGFQDLIVIEPFALSDRNGTEEMILSDNNFGDNRVRRGEVGGAQGISTEETWKRERIHCKTLDEFCRERSLPAQEISLVWIDAQGFEGFVLSGGKALLEANHVPILIEFWPKGLMDSGSFEPLLALVEAHFVAVYDMRFQKEIPPDGLRAYSQSFLHADFTDLLLLPRLYSARSQSELLRSRFWATPASATKKRP